MRVSFVFIGILLLGITSCNNVRSLVKSISKENRIECERLGFEGSPSEIYQKYEKLKNSASKEQLLELTNYEQFAVAGYASYALIERKLISPFLLFEKFYLKDKSGSTFCGCIVSQDNLSDLIYMNYYAMQVEIKYTDDYTNSERIFTDTKDLLKMDSLILYSENPGRFYLRMILGDRIYPHNYIPRIEELAFEKRNDFALEYVFNNIRIGNEEKLIEAANEIISNKDSHYIQTDLAESILKELNN